VAARDRDVGGRSGIAVLEDVGQLGLFVFGAEDVEVQRVGEQRVVVRRALDDNGVALLREQCSTSGARQLQMAGPLYLHVGSIPDQRVGLYVAPDRLRGDLVALVATTQHRSDGVA